MTTELFIPNLVYNHFPNTFFMRLFDAFPNFPFTTDETMRDYYL